MEFEFTKVDIAALSEVELDDIVGGTSGVVRPGSTPA